MPVHLVQKVKCDSEDCWSLDKLFFLCLQIQRNLQLRIEEQGKYLQMMFEKQNSGLTKGTASTSDYAAKSEQEDKKTVDSKELAAEETRECEEPESPQPKRPKTDNWKNLSTGSFQEFNSEREKESSLILRVYQDFSLSTVLTIFLMEEDSQLCCVDKRTDPQEKKIKSLGESSHSNVI